MHDNKSWDLFPFSEFSSTDYRRIILEKIKKAEQDIETIIYQSEEPTFSNTILRLENNVHIYTRFVEVFFNLNSACTDEVIQKDAHEIAEKLSAFNNSIILNDHLFKRVEKVYQNEYTETQALDGESLKLLKDTYESFVRNGARLSEDKKDKIKQIDAELSRLTLIFSDNVLEETNNEFLHIENGEELTGLNDDYLNMYQQAAQSKGLTGYVITLQYPSYMPFMKYCSNRKLRELLYHKYLTRGNRENDFNNSEVIKKIVNLRYERAEILGYISHAHFTLERRMAQTPEKVRSFLDDLYSRAWKFALNDIESLKKVAHEYGIEEIAAYDHAFISEKLKREIHDFSDEDLKPFLSLNDCLNAVFQLSYNLYGLEFKKIDNAEKYHEDVEVYAVIENKQFKAILYTDFFPRDNKKPGAWMTVFKNQRMEGQMNIRPHISIVCNFSPPTDSLPSLLTFDEFTTLFHEFGHALHGILADTKYESMSGTNVYWDFVELPSQFMENFCYNKKYLHSWAKHYQTAEVIPEELIDKIISSSQFMEPYQTVRQLSFGLLDLAYYSQKPGNIRNIIDFEREAISHTQLYPWYRDSVLSTSFAHIFGGGYDAGYYSYKWAEVLDADAYDYLEKNNFTPEIVAKFKTLLSSGGTKDPMELYKEFRGREPDSSALLRRAGIE